MERRLAWSFAIAAAIVMQGGAVPAMRGSSVPPDPPVSATAAVAGPLQIHASTEQSKVAATGHYRISLTLRARLAVHSSGWKAADVVFVARDSATSNVVAGAADTFRLSSNIRNGPGFASGIWRTEFDVPAGTFTLRLAVRELAGVIATTTQRLEVGPLTREDTAVGDLTIDSLDNAAFGTPHAYTKDGFRAVVETYAITDAPLADLQASVVLRRHDGKTAVRTVNAAFDPVRQQESGAARRAYFVVSLDDVPQGHYLATVRVRSGDKEIAERTRSVHVLQGSPIHPAGTAASQLSIAAVDMLRGRLAQNYIAWLCERAKGTAALEACRGAASGEWEAVELQARRIRDYNGVVQALRGLSLFAREDYTGAMASLKLASHAEPASSLTAFFLGWASEAAGETVTALNAWRKAVALDPTLEPAHLALADAHLRLANVVLAMHAIKTGLSALPSSPELMTRLRQIQQIAQ